MNCFIYKLKEIIMLYFALLILILIIFSFVKIYKGDDKNGKKNR